jgi:TonB family protein
VEKLHPEEHSMQQHRAEKEGHTGKMAMQASGPSVSDRFGLLPEHRGRFSSFTVSIGLNLALGALALWFAISQLHKPTVPRYESTQLIFAPTTPPPPVEVPPVPHIKVVAPPVQVVEAPRKIELPKPVVEPPKPEVVKMNTPAMPVLPSAPPKQVITPPQPKVGLFAAAKPTAVANNQAPPTVQSGGFGNPAGATVNPASHASATPAMGSFSSAPGANQGAGASRQGTVQAAGFNTGTANGVPGGTSRGTVASAGFGNGVVGGTPGGTGTTRGGVASAGFGTTIGGSTPPAAKAQASTFVAPEVISEPRPQYTDEARQLKIQGEVTLEVNFGANGKVQVLRVVNRLGHGLDEQAERVAQQIRFKPAARNGQPVDQITTIHILFQLA